MHDKPFYSTQDRDQSWDDHSMDALRYAGRVNMSIPQSKRQSWIEAHANTWIGFGLSWLTTILCMAYLPQHIGIFWTTNITVGLCTVWSLIRGYYVRRYFNSRHK